MEINFKGFDFNLKPITNSFHRKSLFFSNKIQKTLGYLGIPDDNIEIEECKMPLVKKEAKLNWEADGFSCEISCSDAGKFIDNIQLISLLITKEVKRVQNEEIKEEDFYKKYAKEL